MNFRSRTYVKLIDIREPNDLNHEVGAICRRHSRCDAAPEYIIVVDDDIDIINDDVRRRDAPRSEGRHRNSRWYDVLMA
jgi:hypothetical protein